MSKHRGPSTGPGRLESSTRPSPAVSLGSASRAALASSRRKRRNDDDDRGEEEVDEDPAEARRRARGPDRSPLAAPAAAPAAADGGVAARPAIATAAHQALLRFFTVNGRATFTEVEKFFNETKDKCSGAASKALPLVTAWDHLNQYIRFMELEIRRIKSEVDDQEHWVLVDNTERVAAANASCMRDVGDEEGAEEQKEARPAAAAAAASASSANKGKDAGSMAQFLNPSQFNHKQTLYFKALLDAILHSNSGQVSQSDAHDLRRVAAPEKKNQLTEDDVLLTLAELQRHGWIRENPNEPGAVGRRGVAKPASLCLGERSYAELRAYVEEQTQGKKCASCQQSCLLGVTCVNQSSESKRAAESDDPATHRVCDVKIHYHCARQMFIRRGRKECTGCGSTWDKYLAQHGGDAAPMEDADDALAPPFSPPPAAAPARSPVIARR